MSYLYLVTSLKLVHEWLNENQLIQNIIKRRKLFLVKFCRFYLTDYLRFILLTYDRLEGVLWV